MKTRSLGIAFAALLAFAPARGNAGQTAGTVAPANAATSADPGERAASAPRPSMTGEVVPATETAPRKPRKKNLRRHAYWEPFPIYWPSYHRQHLTWQRLAWFNWF